MLVCLLGTLLCGCYENEDSGPDMVDPWLRERTPASLRLENQIGAAVITDDWRHDESGNIRVQLVTGGIADWSKVKVVDIELQYNATASISAGSTLDMSSGTGSFVVTAENGETRTYTVSYDAFKEPLEGVYLLDPISGILDGSAPKCSMVVHGGQEGGVVLCTAMDKSWQWGNGYMPTDEDDNSISIKLERVDEVTGVSYGSIVNEAGPDGKYANYRYQNKAEKDVNGKYRMIPTGKSRWTKESGSNVMSIYAWEDADCAAPLWTVEVLGAGSYPLYGDKVFTVANQAFHREFDGPFNVKTDDWSDDRWFVNNVRNTFWTIRKSSDTPLENHDELLQQN